jgi:hypothetical protein
VAPRLPAADKTHRDLEIIGARAAGYTVSTIARRHGLDERHVRRILQEHRQRQPPLTTRFDPAQIAMETIEQLDHIVEELAELAAQASQEAVRLGALRTKLVALRDRTSLLQSLGLLPADLGVVADQIDVRLSIEIISKFLVEQNVPRDAIRRLVHQLDPGTATLNGFSRTG